MHVTKKHNTILVSIFMEHNGNWNIAADTLWYWHVVYPVCVNANPVPQKMYRIEVIVIQMCVNDANNLNICQVVTFNYPIRDTWSSFSYKGISKINMVFQVSQYKRMIVTNITVSDTLKYPCLLVGPCFCWSNPGIDLHHTYPCMTDSTSGRSIY